MRIQNRRDDRCRIASVRLEIRQILRTDFADRAAIVVTRRVPVQRAVEWDEIPYPYKVHDTTLHSRA